MLKTLKSKISLLYFGLVALIAIVGIVSVYSLFKLSKAVDGLMTHNYKSIKAIANMQDALGKQDRDIMLFMNDNKISGIKQFTQNEKIFQENFVIEQHNITEPGESGYVNLIKKSYYNYLNLFNELQNISGENSANISEDFYNNSIVSEFNKMKLYLKKVSDLNEKAMFQSKDNATKDSLGDMYLLIGLSISSVGIGFLISTLLISRFMKPLRSLTQTIKLVREGDLNQQATILSSDEVGELATEFNNMTKRLSEFEKSSIGKLMQEKNKSFALVKSIYDPLVVLDGNYRVQLVNVAFEKVFNLVEDDILNRNFFEVMKNEEIFEYISGTFKRKEEFKEKIIFIKNDEDIDFYYNVIVSSVRDSDFKETGIVVSFHNVTQLKQLEIVKTDFLSTISHELKTPLTSIMMGTGLIGDESLGHLSRKQKSILNTMKEDSERLSLLVNDLLEISRIESGKAVFNMKLFKIEKIIESSMRVINELAKNKGVRLSFKFEDELPSINVDNEKIAWVMNNLLTNALKYSKQGDSIHINSFEKEGRIFVSITDNGIGIPEEYQNKIFDKFVQVRGQDTEIRGTGLGLAIVKEILEAHGGEIWCESEPEKGSTFTFTIPLTDRRNT